jgi:hypothetical protein
MVRQRIVPISLLYQVEEESKEKESDTVSGGERIIGSERGRSASKSEKEERQQPELTKPLAGTLAPYVDPPSDKAPSESLEVRGRRGGSGRESDR